MSAVKQMLGGNIRQYGIVGALFAIVLIFQFLTDGKLLLPNNVASLIQQNAYVMILAAGMVIVIIAGHIDLSVGSIVGFIGGVVAIMMQHWGWPWWLAILAGLALGAVVGTWQGFWVAYVGVPAFIVTLAGWLAFRGLAILLVGVTVSIGTQPQFVAISNGSIANFLGYIDNRDVVTLVIGALVIALMVFSQLRSRRIMQSHGLAVEPAVAVWARLAVLTVLVAFFAWTLAGSRGGTPIVLIIVGIVIVTYSFVTRRTVFGRNVYAMGGNLQGAMLSGVDTKKMNFFIFVNIGFLASIAAVVTTSKAGAAVGSAGNLYELDAIAACFIGGTSVSGGIGRISGVMVGALIMGVLNIGLSILQVDPAWQQVLKGLVLLLAVAFDLNAKRRAGTR
ncbi:sugar ABC transporter permease [Isoptericola sp. b441]|uniref:Xylose transport system permease protein XylH n=1 Tax=Actinotalea lenta TaxID=3064654 RepID=A0ABT9DBC4_9CELL|nr:MULTISPECIES: multiple monosaccharide ABC transporter permease [unclassified Isoptericola]MDO8106616.1 sugar ABC transporter permease [Isoptericola sp. b441]MDO8121676.1 sugar ABC transporter permease [Isoptericola sp. b490]